MKCLKRIFNKIITKKTMPETINQDLQVVSSMTDSGSEVSGIERDESGIVSGLVGETKSSETDEERARIDRIRAEADRLIEKNNNLPFMKEIEAIEKCLGANGLPQIKWVAQE